MIDYSLEHICSYNATLASPEIIGPVPEGLRINVYVTGGEVSGPKLRGKLRPVGGDWLTVWTDGMGILDVRITIETHDGALIYAAYSGLVDLGEDGYQRFLQGQLPASGTPIRTAHAFTPLIRTIAGSTVSSAWASARPFWNAPRWRTTCMPCGKASGCQSRDI